MYFLLPSRSFDTICSIPLTASLSTSTVNYKATPWTCTSHLYNIHFSRVKSAVFFLFFGPLNEVPPHSRFCFSFGGGSILLVTESSHVSTSLDFQELLTDSRWNLTRVLGIKIIQCVRWVLSIWNGVCDSVVILILVDSHWGLVGG